MVEPSESCGTISAHRSQVGGGTDPSSLPWSQYYFQATEHCPIFLITGHAFFTPFINAGRNSSCSAYGNYVQDLSHLLFDYLHLSLSVVPFWVHNFYLWPLVQALGRGFTTFVSVKLLHALTLGRGRVTPTSSLSELHVHFSTMDENQNM